MKRFFPNVSNQNQEDYYVIYISPKPIMFLPAGFANIFANICLL